MEIENAGLGAKNGSGSMVLSDKTGRALGGASRLINKGDEVSAKTTEEVEILKLDDSLLSDRHVSIIQLDVEGFEQEALSGAMATIKRCKPIIILEELPESDWITKNILSLGYRLSGNLHINSVFTPESRL